MRVLKWLRSLFTKKPVVAYYTVDGGHLCPYPGMTDDDLLDFEEWAASLRR